MLPAPFLCNACTAHTIFTTHLELVDFGTIFLAFYVFRPGHDPTIDNLRGFQRHWSSGHCGGLDWGGGMVAGIVFQYDGEEMLSARELALLGGLAAGFWRLGGYHLITMLVDIT